MIIEELLLVGYDRFDTKEIQSIHWKPNSNLALILGSNGCGKSSLLKEMNPMPAERNDYNVGGMKRFVCSYNGDQYILTSDFTKGAKHSFKRIRAGVEEELNDSATITIQKELVYTHLRYNSLIHEVLTGQLSFTDLSPVGRKELLTVISPLHLDYPLSIFEKARVLNRDDVGAIKHQLTKCSDLEQKLSAIEVTEDSSTIDSLENEIQKLLPFKGNKEVDVESIYKLIDSICESMDIGISKWSKWISGIELLPGVNSLETLNITIGNLDSNLETSNSITKALTKRSLELTKVIDQIDNGGLSKEVLESRVVTLYKSISKMKDNYRVKANWESIINDVRSLSDKIENVSPVEAVYIFTNEEIDTLKSQYDTVHSRRVNLLNSIETTVNKIKHLESDKESVICPKCKLTLSISGIDIATEISNLKSKLKQYDEEIESMHDSIREVECNRARINTYTELYGNIKAVRGATNYLWDFWQGAPSIDEIIKNLSAFLTYGIMYCKYVEGCQLYYTRLNEYELYKKSLEQYSIIGLDPGEEHKEVTENINREIDKQQYLTEQLALHKKALSMYTHFYGVTEKCELMVERIFEAFNLLIDATISEDASNRLTLIYNRLGNIKHLVNMKTTLTRSVEESREEVLMLKERQSNAEILSNILSPNKGIIAEQMQGFVNSFIEQMNLITDQIWLHQLEILSCKMENGVLDYKFPICKEGKNSGDISMCSTGQKEIINLAFVLVMRQYLNITEYPLFLDEPGTGFDPAHRTELLKFIKMLIETKQCTQIFMVNHYSEWHGGLSNHETVVLDSRNIVVPNPCNQNVKFNTGV